MAITLAAECTALASASSSFLTSTTNSEGASPTLKQKITAARVSASSQVGADVLSTATRNADKQGQHGVRFGRRSILLPGLNAAVALLVLPMPKRVLAEEGENQKNDQSILGGLLSLFDANETNKLGKQLPKAYLKSAREVVKTLRESFTEDTGNDAKFRRTADSAKGAIRDYIVNWRGSKVIDTEQSYQALERALRLLGEFYSKMGPRAVLPEDVRTRVLNDLQMADDAL